MSRQRDYQLRHIAEGRCQGCPNWAEPGVTFCFVCLVKKRTAARLAYSPAQGRALGSILGLQLQSRGELKWKRERERL